MAAMKIHLYGANESRAPTSDAAIPRPTSTVGRRQQAAQIPSDASTAAAVANFTLAYLLTREFTELHARAATEDEFSALTLIHDTRR